MLTENLRALSPNDRICITDPWHVKLHALSTLALKRLYNGLGDHGGKGGRPLAAKTAGHTASMVSRALGDGIRWRLLKVNPASSCQLPKVEQREAKILEPSEIKWMLAATQADSARWLSAFLVLAIASGARRGAARRVARFHLDRYQLRDGCPQHLKIAGTDKARSGGQDSEEPQESCPSSPTARN